MRRFNGVGVPDVARCARHQPRVSCPGSTRKRSRGAAVLVYGLFLILCAPKLGFALGLGVLEKRSRLNEPFYGVIELVNAGAEELDSMSVKLADAERFRRAGLDRPAFLSQLRFEVVETDAGPDYIKVTTSEPVREPFLGFLIEVNWSKGRLFREFSVLFDPPGYKPQVAPVRPAPTRVAPTAPRASSKAKVVEAPRPRSPAAVAVDREPLAAKQYGPTVSGDSAWKIASKVARSSGSDVQQIIVALLRNNPQAFFQDNVNALKRGVVLDIPDRQAISMIGRQAALQVMNQHNALWEDYRQRMAIAKLPRAVGETSSAGSGVAEEAAQAVKSDDARLELVAADQSDAAVRASDSKPTQAAKTGKSLTLAEETVSSQRSEIKELNEKLDESDQVIKLLRRQIELKDQELAALQAKVADTQRPLASGGSGALGATTPLEAPAPAGAAATDGAPMQDEEAVEAGTAEPTSGESVAELGAGDAASPEAPAAPATINQVPEIPATPSQGPGTEAQTKDSDATVGSEARDTGEEKAAAPGVTPVGDSSAEEVEQSEEGIFGGSRAPIVLGALAFALAVAWYLVKRGQPAVVGSERRTDLEVPGSLQPHQHAGVAPASEPVAEFETVSRVEDQSTAPPALEVEEEDPLADVDVYLAYERFAEAERLVKQAIESNPDEHKYKLRLLEVYYASGNKTAYENYARVFRDAVSGSGALWESAVAMWQAISPERSLFGESVAGASQETPASSREFIDLGGGEPIGAETEGTSPGAGPSTVSLVSRPGAEKSSTVTPSELDFDLGQGAQTSGAASQSPFLDFESTPPHNRRSEGLVDVSRDTDAADTATPAFDPPLGDIIDLTIGERSVASHGEEMGETIVDIRKASTPAADTEFFDISSPRVGDKEEHLTGSSSADFIDLSVASASSVELPDDSGNISLTEVDFSVSDQSLSSDSIRSLEGTQTAAPEALQETVAMDFSTAGDATEVSSRVTDQEATFTATQSPAYSFEREAGTVEFDLSDLDFDIVEAESPGQADEPRPVSAAGLQPEQFDAAVSEELIRESEQPEPTLDDGLEIDRLSYDSTEVSELLHEETRRLDLPAGIAVEEADGAAAETDIKLNLAKAYIELGDVDGARSILGEVTERGTAGQREEAEELLRQLG